MQKPRTDQGVPRDAIQVAALLASCAHGSQQAGLELEMGLVTADGLGPASYEAISRVLQRLLDGDAWDRAVQEAGQLIGLEAEGGAAISLEPGGQFEFSTRPHSDLVSLAADTRAATAAIAAAAEAEGLWLIGGGLQPFAQEAAPWMPKSRYVIMREYFASLGEPGRLAHHMMQRTLSIQVSVDYLNEADALEILRLSFLAAPVMTAIFAASPFDGEREAELLSARANAWLYTDPARAGEIVSCAEPGASLRDYAEFALDVPMMFRVKDGDYLPMHGASFRTVLEEGHWPDGAEVSEKDLWTQLGGIFTDARLKKGLVELRSTDGQRPADVIGIPAMWVGLIYDAQARADAIALLGELSSEARRQALRAVPRFAFSAPWGERPVLEVARSLVQIARQGLERRVEADLERPGALELLAPVERRVQAGVTPAEELLEAWRGELGQDRRALIESLRFPHA